MHPSAVRALFLAAAFGLIALGCSSSEGDSATQSSLPEEVGTSTEPGDTEPAASASSPCSVADDATITALGQSGVARAAEGMVAGVSNCRYELTEGGTVQIISLPATLWAKQIPEALQQLAASPIADAPLTAAKINAALEMIADGRPTPMRAPARCSV